MAVVLSACGGNSQPSSAPPPTTSPTSTNVREIGGDEDVSNLRLRSLTGAEASFTQPPAIVWPAVLKAYDKVGIPLSLSDERSMTAGNQGLKLVGKLGKTPLSTYFDCGRDVLGVRADTYTLIISVVSKVAPEGSGAQVQTTVLAQGINPRGGSTGGSISCGTTGMLEQDLHTAINAALKS